MTTHLVPLLDIVADVTKRWRRIKRRDYLTSGIVPIIDQGQEFIGGYTNEEGAALAPSPPVIVFGDHTRAFKYVDFPFVLGADGAKVLQQIRHDVDPQFLFFFLRSIRLPSAGYSRHFKFLKEVHVPLPPLPEQRRIVDILNRAEGIRRLRRQAEEKARQTVPAVVSASLSGLEGGKTTALSEICSKITDGTHQSPKFVSEGIPFIFISNIVSGEISFETSKFISDKEYDELTRRVPIEIGDTLYSTVGSYGIAVHVATNQKFCFQRHIAILKPNCDLVRPRFLTALMNTMMVRTQADHAARGVAQKTVNLGDIKRFTVVLPDLGIQDAVVEQLEAIGAVSTRQRKASEMADALVASLQNALLHPAGKAPEVAPNSLRQLA